MVCVSLLCLTSPVVLVIILRVAAEHPIFLYVFCGADVPDAPKNLAISELNSPRNISLVWVPGSDHNSSVTGKYFCRRRDWWWWWWFGRGVMLNNATERSSAVACILCTVETVYTLVYSL